MLTRMSPKYLYNTKQIVIEEMDPEFVQPLFSIERALQRDTGKRYQIILSRVTTNNASADGEFIRIGMEYLNLPYATLAAIVAHEWGHMLYSHAYHGDTFSKRARNEAEADIFSAAFLARNHLPYQPWLSYLAQVPDPTPQAPDEHGTYAQRAARITTSYLQTYRAMQTPVCPVIDIRQQQRTVLAY